MLIVVATEIESYFRIQVPVLWVPRVLILDPLKKRQKKKKTNRGGDWSMGGNVPLLRF